MTADNSQTKSGGSASYDHDQNTVVDTTRGKLLTDIQMSAESVPMTSTLRPMALLDNTAHDILSILQRPVNLGSYAWATTDAALPIQLPYTDYVADTPKYLRKLDFPQAIFEASPLVVEKLRNYQYLKANIEVEVKINAQPFLQGALMLVYNPYYSNVDKFRSAGTRFMASQTSCPYKIVSVEEGNSVKLTCPYANIYDLFDLANSNNQFGSFFLYVFSALRGAEASASARYTIFARFVDPEFYVPTQVDVISEASERHARVRSRARARYAQASVAPVAAPDTGEVETAGPVSKLASGVTTVAEVLSDIPLLGSVASSVAWVSRAIGKTAASFGWSKVTTIQPQSKSVLKPNLTLVHTEGNDDETTLALLQDNGIDGSSFVPETKDEMSLSSLLGRPNYFHAQTASQTLFSGRKLITKWEVSPFSEYQYGDSEDSQTLYLGSFAYASMFGTFWRGQICFDIMVIKTPYHNGRFAVVYMPETNLADVPAELGEMLNTNYNVVCNLKDRQDELGRTTFRIETPFISNTPWRETYRRSTVVDNPGPDATTLDTKIGSMAIYSLTDLTNPPTVDASVTFYIAHSAGPDYQIARPTLQLTPGYQQRYAQSDVGSVFIPENENLLVPSHTQKDVTAQTTGEYFTSLRALVKRFARFAELKPSTEFYTGIRSRFFTEDDESGQRVNGYLPTPFYMISFLFRFYNGSSRLKLLPPVPNTMAQAFVSFDENKNTELNLPRSFDIGQPVFAQSQQVSNVFEVRTPYYRGVRADVMGSNQTPIFGDVRTNLIHYNASGYGSTTANATLYEAAGDDYTAFFQVGPPPMCDIRNITDTPVLPTLNQYTIDLANVNTIRTLTSWFEVDPVTFTPQIEPDGVWYPIAAAVPGSFTLVTSAGNTTVNFSDCQIKRNPFSGLRIPRPAGATEAAGTLASITGVGTVQISSIATPA